MKKNKGKVLSILIILLSIITIGINTYAHSGRTDSSGGHKDNKNKSGLGSYHYHCGGHPAHLHKNGVCPYSTNKSNTSNSSSSKKNSTSSSSSKKSNNSSSSSSKKTTTTKKTTTIVASAIKINEEIENMEIGESKILTATITPNNVTDKTVKWKSSDQSIVTINEAGKIIAKKGGSVDITATTSNGKTNTINIKVKEKPKKEIIPVVATTTNNDISKNTTPNAGVGKNNGNTNNIEKSKSSENGEVGTVVALGALGAGGYWVYKKSKKEK